VNRNTKSELASWSRGWLPGCLLIAATFLVYWPALNASFIWDDDFYVTGNPTLRSLAGLGKIWFQPAASPQYYPLVFTTFWVEYHLWRLHPLGYHLINILLHTLNAILLWRVLRRLQVPGSWCAAALFALHPVMVESVAWVTERKNVLSGLFYLLAVLAFLRFRPLTNGEAASARNWRFYPLVLVLFLGALWSKTVTCSLPAALLLLLWWKRGRVEKRDVLALAPIFVLGAGLGLVTAWLEKHHVGASGADWTLSFSQRCLLAGRALWFYAGKLIYPDPLTFIYPRWQMDSSEAWQYLFSLAALAVLLVLWFLRRRIGRGPLVAVLFFAGTLAPALGFFDVFPFRYSFVADHFQYLASIGLLTLIAGAGAAICGRAGQPGSVLGSVVAGVVLLGLGALTWRQAGIYQNAETLWRTTIARNPNSFLACHNLGSLLATRGRLDEALENYQKALALEPDLAAAHFDLGLLLVRLNRFDEASEHYRKALELKPDYADAGYNLGVLFADQRQTNQAIACYQKTLQINPRYADAAYNLGVLLAGQGQTDRAAELYRKAVEANPNHIEAHYNLANLLAARSRTVEAAAHYRQALAINPGHFGAHYNLGVISGQQGQLEDALEHFQKAVQIQPGHAEAHYHLALVLGMKGRLNEAIEQLQCVTAIKPDYAETYYNLGLVFAAQGRTAEAIQHYQKAIRLKPDYPDARNHLAQLLAAQGRLAEALQEYQRMLELDPKNISAHLRLAWLLATGPEASGRNGHQAVALAEQAKALAGMESPQLLDTLAAAYAEAGRFPEAVETARRALNLPATRNNPPLAEAIQARLKLYEAHAPFRDTDASLPHQPGNPP
jgi:protein O-mannosyl-transferase